MVSAQSQRRARWGTFYHCRWLLDDVVGVIGHMAFEAEDSQGKGQNIHPKQILLQHSPG
jgi:hypothetical protein